MDALGGTVHDVREEIRKLLQLHDQLLDLFMPVRNKKDMELDDHVVAMPIEAISSS